MRLLAVQRFFVSFVLYLSKINDSLSFSFQRSISSRVAAKTKPLWSSQLYTPELMDVLESFKRNHHQIPLVCIPGAINTDLVRRISSDAVSLKALGFGAAAGVASKSDNIRRNVHQIWLKSPGSPDKLPFIGEIDARKELFRFIDMIRYVLSAADDDYDTKLSYARLSPDGIELSYLFYERGAFYGRHMDVITDTFSQDQVFKRTVSLLLYLGDPIDSHRSWDYSSDGGALRIHDAKFAKFSGFPIVGFPIVVNDKDEIYSDINPEAGTLVLFDSARVPHEVLETNRNRLCIVGWLNARK